MLIGIYRLSGEAGARKTDYFLPLREVTVYDRLKHPKLN